MAADLTHSELCTLAYRWLLSKRGGCAVAVVEPCASVPDAIGWTRFGYTVVVEAKRSLSDYTADGKKTSHLADLVPGHRRWYITPAGMVPRSGLRPGWGLLEVRNGRVRVAHQAPDVAPSIGSMRESTAILTAVARRLRDGGSIDPESGKLGWPMARDAIDRVLKRRVGAAVKRLRDDMGGAFVPDVWPVSDDR